ncbi:MAG: flagellar motor protein MotB [Lachnospiraceae bacterium]|nr:flagellar motor protein MotB [Lachnospiraceae bacterium]MCI8873439.1 flagellar motor protein MotB [Lachnospiraceae bacterium]MCI9060007.1 flagellar motor protein MotB [Lachnospiraceae bacterium]GFI31180.1 outer membrane porin F [Lachnospiraceae bacterium]
MAKKKKKDSGGGAANWMNTFADLMNLLLCFFVLLFSMSSVDADKFEALVQSLEHSFSILPQGGSSIGDGQMVAAGVNQLQLLDQYYLEAANSKSEEEGEDNESEEQNPEEALKQEMAEAGLKESEEMAEQIEKMLEEQRIGDQVEIDSNAQFVRVTLNGALLFDSGQSKIREDALPLVDKLSLILENYDSSLIDIEGHTDNVPISNEQYENNDVLSAYRAFAVKNYVLEKTALEAGKINATGCGEYNPVADNGTPEGRARNRRVEIKIYNSYNSN